MENISNPHEPFGLYEVSIITILATSAGFFGSIQKLSLGYIFHEPHFWCSSGMPMHDQCQKYENTSTTPCDNWDYDRSEYPETIVSQFNLVCDERYWIFLSQSIYIFGYVIGTFGSGIISDKFGRKPTILVSAVLCHLFSSTAAFSSTIVEFNICRFCIAASAVSLYIVSFTYCMEIAGTKWKSFVSSLFGVSISIGITLVPLLSWFFPSWSDLQLFATLPTILIMVHLFIPSFFQRIFEVAFRECNL